MSLDLFLATIVFVSIMVTMIFMWDFARERSSSLEEQRDIQIQSRQALNSLLLTPGSPASWEEYNSVNKTNVSSIGLANEPFSINQRKIQRLASANSTFYDDYKTILGLQGFDFTFEMYSYTDSQQKFSTVPIYRAGKTAASNISELIVLERLVLMDGTQKKAVLAVFRDE